MRELVEELGGADDRHIVHRKKAAKGCSHYCEHLFAASLSSFHEVLLKTSRRSGEFQNICAKRAGC
jgi:hypothetical protein